MNILTVKELRKIVLNIGDIDYQNPKKYINKVLILPELRKVHKIPIKTINGFFETGGLWQSPRAGYWGASSRYIGITCASVTLNTLAGCCGIAVLSNTSTIIDSYRSMNANSTSLIAKIKYMSLLILLLSAYKYHGKIIATDSKEGLYYGREEHKIFYKKDGKTIINPKSGNLVTQYRVELPDNLIACTSSVSKKFNYGCNI